MALKELIANKQIINDVRSYVVMLSVYRSLLIFCVGCDFDVEDFWQFFGGMRDNSSDGVINHDVIPSLKSVDGLTAKLGLYGVLQVTKTMLHSTSIK